MKAKAIVRHVGVVISNIEKSLKFYQGLLGFEIKVEALEVGLFINKILGRNKVQVKTIKMASADGGAMIELLHFDNPRGMINTTSLFGVGITHFALTVDDLSALYKKMKSEGVEFISPPQVSDDGKALVAFCLDPDSNYIELVEQKGG